MNFYFLLEDEKSFLKVLPSWLEHMGFGCTRVADLCEVQDHDYVLQSGQGVTQLVTKALFDTIDSILQNPGKIDKLVVVLDAEELEAEERRQKVTEQIKRHYESSDLGFDIEIFVCDRCFETWLLGCCGLYPKDVEETSDFYQYYKHYNIEEQDPEEMIPPPDNDDTIAKYHFHYLHELLRYKKIRYSKNRPQNVAADGYLKGIIKRINTTEHLKSFKVFYNFISAMRKN
ncbi:MAG: hypothetical protein HFI65_01520 [Lachnospiraceae bacterium]|nr:hypothetical protein [Lachnospiraceae bacterium]